MAVKTKPRGESAQTRASAQTKLESYEKPKVRSGCAGLFRCSLARSKLSTIWTLGGRRSSAEIQAGTISGTGLPAGDLGWLAFDAFEQRRGFRILLHCQQPTQHLRRNKNRERLRGSTSHAAGFGLGEAGAL